MRVSGPGWIESPVEAMGEEQSVGDSGARNGQKANVATSSVPSQSGFELRGKPRSSQLQEAHGLGYSYNLGAPKW